MSDMFATLGELYNAAFAALIGWWHQPFYQCAWDVLKLVVWGIGAAEVFKYLSRFVFGRKSRLVRIIEGLEGQY